MNDDLSLTPRGADLIKHFESCMQKKGEHYHAYHCPAGVLTIGWGHTHHHGRKFNVSSRWTREECDEAFLEDMEGFERAVRRLVKVPLEPYQFDALVSFDYNTGALGKSTLLKKVNAGDFEGAAKEFHKWNKATVNGKKQVMRGLVRRRSSEALLFQDILDLDYDGKPDPMPQIVDEPKEK